MSFLLKIISVTQKDFVVGVFLCNGLLGIYPRIVRGRKLFDNLFLFL